MPGSGKSTVGIILAKYLALGFIDTDVLIQTRQQRSLQEIINESDHLNLREIEEKEILEINVRDHVIATGGSVVYSENAMNHLRDISTIVFLEVEFEGILKRIHNFETRGIAKAKSQTFRDLFNERQALYKEYAELTIDANDHTQEEVAEMIALELNANRL